MSPQNGNTTNGVHSKFYTPPPNVQCREVEFRNYIQKRFNVDVSNYEKLHKWSVDHYDDFWSSLLSFAEVKLGNEPSGTIDMKKKMIDFPLWFPGSTLNYTENILLRGKDEDVAFITALSNLDLKVHRYNELRAHVQGIATSLRALGVTKGDHVCGYLPNSYETSVAMFATAAIGAVWCSASTDFGPTGVLDRFKQVNPKVLFTVEAVSYKNKRFELRDKLNQIVSGLPTLEKVIQINHLNSNLEFNNLEQSSIYESWDSFLTEENHIPQPFVYEKVSFGHPLFVMFSSGTTGPPKGLVHTVGGTLLKHIEEHLIQGDAKPTDRIFFYTTCGWMMWNWLMSFLYAGGSIVLYDESPLEPDAHIILKIAAKTKSTSIGMGAKLYDEYTKMNVDFKSLYDLKNLRLIYSTGSPLKSEAFEFINEHIAPQAVIGSISGGTDIIGCFMGASFTKPVVAGECTVPYLGMKIASMCAEGNEVLDQEGELVCLVPFPSMPSHFLNDADKTLYKQAYFSKYDQHWAHGDRCSISSTTGGIVMHGRSDTTLNRGGVRIGTAEIYAVVETFREITDSIVAGQAVPDEQDEKFFLFVKMSEDDQLTPELKKRICLELRTRMSPRHVPNEIFAVNDIPYTNSGKKVEMAVKKIINGAQPVKASSLRNPDSLDQFVQFQTAN